VPPMVPINTTDWGNTRAPAATGGAVTNQ
jgi:hypothetical protein